MAGRGGSYSISWLIIGFLAGVAATLAFILVAFHAHSRRPEAVQVAPAAQPARPARRAELASPKPPPAPTPAQVDEQTAEDAAAAGMTSRSHTSPPSQ